MTAPVPRRNEASCRNPLTPGGALLTDGAVRAAAEATSRLRREGVGCPGPEFFSTPYARASLEALRHFHATTGREALTEVVERALFGPQMERRKAERVVRRLLGEPEDDE